MSLVVDAHVHLNDYGYWPDPYFEIASAKSGKPPKEVEDGLVDPGGKRLLEQMDILGIDNAVILSLDWSLGMEADAPVSIEDVHKAYADLARSTNGKLIPFAGVDPRRPNALEILTEAHDLGLAGLKLYPPSGFYPYDEVVFPLAEACQEWGVPLVFHTGATVASLRPRFGNPLFIQDVQRKFRNLTIWIAHAGSEYWWEESVAVARSGLDTYLEVSGWQRIMEEDEEAFVKMLSLASKSIGWEKILFGSDHFSGTDFRAIEVYQSWLNWFADLSTTAKKYGVNIPSSAVDAILGGNAARCLGIG
jgi:predicted TIM-barrel fold metal-dependent hydrolase